MHGVRLLAGCLFLAACSGTSNPATTAAFVPTTTTSTSTTTTMETTTTLDRIAEIEAIYQDLTVRRFDALYRGDREAFIALYAHAGFMQFSLDAFDQIAFEEVPQPVVEVLSVLHDGAECIAVENVVHRSERGTTSEPSEEVIELLDGEWLISFSGSGWTCDGPHPFDS